MKHNRLMIIWVALALVSGCAALDRGPAPVLKLGEDLENPVDAGFFDAGWEVALHLDRLDSMDPGASARNFLRDETGQRYDFRLQGQESGPPTVWRGRLIARGDSNETGSFTLTRQGDRLVGRIRINERTYNLRADSPDSGRLYRVDPEQVPEPGPAVVPRDEDQTGGP